MRKSDQYAVSALIYGPLFTGSLYVLLEVVLPLWMPWWVYLFIGLVAAGGWYETSLQLEANRKIVDDEIRDDEARCDRRREPHF